MVMRSLTRGRSMLLGNRSVFSVMQLSKDRTGEPSKMSLSVLPGKSTDKLYEIYQGITRQLTMPLMHFRRHQNE